MASQLKLSNSTVRTKLSQLKDVQLHSPLSMTYALMSTYFGTRGEYPTELEKFMNIQMGMSSMTRDSLVKKNTDELIHLKKTLEETKQSICRIVNGVFVSNKYAVVPDFYKHMNDMEANVSLVDFNNPATVETINKWVTKGTNNMIKKLLSSDDVDIDTTAVILNALYFKGVWHNPFEHTREELFNGKSAPMMHGDNGYYNYYNDSTHQVVELPYKNGYSFGIVLPKNRPDGGYYNLELNVEQYFGKFSKKNVYVVMPKFKQTTKVSYKNYADELGLSSLFKHIDLRNMIDYSADEKMYISDIIQEVVVDVNETGTEASAATAVIAKLECCSVHTEPPINFVADHSFTYYIKHSPTQIVMFQGSLTNL